MQSRYYNPEWGRFLNADGYLNANGDLIGFNMFAYCGNNPVMGYDPTGEWDWGSFFDVVVSTVAVTVGVVVGLATLNVAAGVATTGVINNTVNAIYYHFSDGESDLEQNPNESSYVSQGYIDRWSRLDYVKTQLGGEYTPNAWRYYSEYNFHMYAWMATGWSDNKNIPVISRVALRGRQADVNKHDLDPNIEVYIPTILIGLLGF